VHTIAASDSRPVSLRSEGNTPQVGRPRSNCAERGPIARWGDGRLRAAALGLIAAALGVAALGSVWHLSGVHASLNDQSLQAWMHAWVASRWAALWVVGLYVGAGAVFFPVTVLLGATVLAFGPFRGPLYAMTGALCAALLMHEVGRRMGLRRVERLAGPRSQALRVAVSRHGVWAVAVVRALPVAPFALVNLASGAAGVPRLQFAVGTAIGYIPLLAAFACLGHGVGELLRSRTLAATVPLGCTVIVLLVGAFAVLRVGRRRRRSSSVLGFHREDGRTRGLGGD
jgi:phospholipase D1/2